MKNFMHRIIISLFCFFLIRTYSDIELVYGKDNGVEKTSNIIPHLFLMVKNTEDDIGYINEADIISADELEKESGEEVLRETVNNTKISDSYKLVSEYLKEGKKFEARNELSDLYFAETFNEKRKEIKEMLDELNKELVFSSSPSPDAVIYTVMPGDTLIKIAKKFDTNYEFIMRINRKGRTTIKVGERLKVLNGELSILADKSDFTLTLLLNGHFIKQYPVGLGKSDKTPVGVFIIDNRLINPTWYSPDGVFPFGNPKNVLGTRWMGFEDKEGLYGYGIHGTADPDSIGKEMSNGCIRLRNEDVEELFDFVKAKTRVVIQE